jgi:signal peptidase I
MTKTNTAVTAPSAEQKTGETFFEAIASYAAVFVVGLFIFNFIGQNFVIPSGSMENTLLVGDHLFVDRSTLSPGHNWFPLIHYREPQRGDIIVFWKPVADNVPGSDTPQYLPLVKRLVGVPGDHIHLHDGVVYVNGAPQPLPKTGIDAYDIPVDPSEQAFLDEFPQYPVVPSDGNYKTEQWATEISSHIVNGELVVPPGKYFMMGDHRHDSADSRFWGFVPRENIIGRPLFNYWSFKTPDDRLEQPGIGNKLSWMAHVAAHFFTDTRWSRTLKPVR